MKGISPCQQDLVKGHNAERNSQCHAEIDVQEPADPVFKLKQDHKRNNNQQTCIDGQHKGGAWGCCQAVLNGQQGQTGKCCDPDKQGLSHSEKMEVVQHTRYLQLVAIIGTVFHQDDPVVGELPETNDQHD